MGTETVVEHAPMTNAGLEFMYDVRGSAEAADILFVASDDTILMQTQR